MRRRRAGAAALVLVVAAAGTGWWWVHRPPAVVAACTAAAGSDLFQLEPEQAVNATTIAAEAQRMGLPAHAVSVGLAAALQETKLRNLDYGDRDSLGLFQQRPSQGWGTREQLLQPRYAAAAFFRVLRRVRGWQGMPIYEAAQRVQRSADGSAYAGWDTAARTIARGLTGQTPAGFSCRFPSVRKAGPATRADLLAAVATGLGPGALRDGVTPARGWLVASWLVARAPEHSLARVTFAGRAWTPRHGWRPDPHAPAARVTYALRTD